MHSILNSGGTAIDAIGGVFLDPLLIERTRRIGFSGNPETQYTKTFVRRLLVESELGCRDLLNDPIIGTVVTSISSKYANRETVDVRIECMDEGTHLTVKFHGRWTEQSANRIIETARNEATARGLSNVLIDARNLSFPDVETTQYITGNYIARFLPRRFRVAGIDGRLRMIIHIAGVVSYNRGAKFRVFDYEDDAIRWLLKKSNKFRILTA